MSGVLLSSLLAVALPTADPKTATVGELMASVIKATNQERTRVGVGTLTENDRLVLVAQAMAEDLAKHKRLSHTDSRGKALTDRVNEFEYAWSAIGENVAYGYTTPEAVVQGWIKSPGHYENLIGKDFTQIGVGVSVAANGRVYWAQVFGRPR